MFGLGAVAYSGPGDRGLAQALQQEADRADGLGLGHVTSRAESSKGLEVNGLDLPRILLLVSP